MKNIRKSATVFDFFPNEYKCKQIQIQTDLVLINLYLHLLISQYTEDWGGGQSNTPLINNVTNHILESFQFSFMSHTQITARPAESINLLNGTSLTK